MHRNHLPPTNNHHSESEESDEEESEDEEEQQQQQQVTTGAVAANGNKSANNEEGSDEDSEEEDDQMKDAEEDEDDSDEEESEEKASEKTATTPVRGSGLDYGSDEDDSDDDNPSPNASAFMIKPNSKPPTEANSSKKRSAEEEEKEVKNQKKKAKKVEEVNGNATSTSEEDKVKKGSSGTPLLWKPEDELKILKGMIEFKKETGKDPYSDIGPFYEFVRGSLDADADAVKLKDKIKRLREKYRKTAKKEADGEELVFAKNHEGEAYEKSTKIWGCVVVGGGNGAEAGVNGGGKSKGKGKGKAVKGVEIGMSSGVTVAELGASVLALPVPGKDEAKAEVKENGTAASEKKGVKRANMVKKMELDEVKEKEEEAGEEIDDYMAYIPVKEDDYVLKEGLKKADKGKVKALSKKWKSYQLEAAEMFLERADLVREQTKLILDAFKRSS